MPYALCLMPYALCLTTYTLCLKPYALYLMPYTLCLTPYALHLMPYTFLSCFYQLKTTNYKLQTFFSFLLASGCAGLLPYFFLLKEKSNKKVQGETRTLRAFSPGQRLLLLRCACFFLDGCVIRWYLLAYVLAANSCAVSSGPKLPFQVSL